MMKRTVYFLVMLITLALWAPFVRAEEGLRDIRGPFALPGEWWWLWLLGVALVVGIGYLVVRRLSRPRQASLPLVPERDPWDVALEALAALENEPRDTPERIKYFYSSLSDVIRIYLEERFDLRAPEMTTEEFLEQARSSTHLNNEQKTQLQVFLNEADLVKFARSIPLESDMVAVLRSARGFVKGTWPQVMSDDQGGG